MIRSSRYVNIFVICIHSHIKVRDLGQVLTLYSRPAPKIPVEILAHDLLGNVFAGGAGLDSALSRN